MQSVFFVLGVIIILRLASKQIECTWIIHLLTNNLLRVNYVPGTLPDARHINMNETKRIWKTKQNPHNQFSVRQGTQKLDGQVHCSTIPGVTKGGLVGATGAEKGGPHSWGVSPEYRRGTDMSADESQDTCCNRCKSRAW